VVQSGSATEKQKQDFGIEIVLSFCCTEEEIRRFGMDMRSLFLDDRPRHLAICYRCQTRLESWIKQLRDFDNHVFEQQRRPDA